MTTKKIKSIREQLILKLDGEDKVSVLLAEYSGAQQSAEHYDNLTWAVTTLVVTGVTAFLGFVLEADLQIGSRLFLLVMALVLLVFSVLFTIISTAFKNLKYERCQKIEDIFTRSGLEMINHSQTKKELFKYTGKGSKLLAIVLSVLTAIIIALLVSLFC